MSEVDPRHAYLEVQANCARHMPGSAIDWIARIRDAGRERFAEVGFPTTRDEDWKYTSVRQIQKQSFMPAESRVNGLDRAMVAGLALPEVACFRAVFVNGHYAEKLTDLHGLPKGVWVGSLAQALETCPSKLESVLGRVAPQDTHGFAALNSAFLNDGACVLIDPGCVVNRPIELLFITTASSQPLLAQPRNVIVSGGSSQTTIVERYISLNETVEFTNAVTEVSAGADSIIDHYKIQEQNQNAFHVTGLYIHQERDSTVTNNNVALGGQLARTDIRTQLDAEGACCNLYGLYLAAGIQHIDNHTQVDHRKPRCTSREVYKGVLDDRAHAVFHGRVVVYQDAQHTDAEQENKNLLLSPDAEIDTKPQLEIYADDVKCSHGATVGQLDPSAMFYLRSRGISDKDARSLLTYAFANDVISQFQLESVRKWLEHVLPQKLFHGEREGAWS